MRHFASDNYAGICPEALAALLAANREHALPYGDDEYTARAADLLRQTFECDVDVYFCFSGTAANAMVLAHLVAPYQAVIAHERAHVETDECGAPEFFANGAKLLLAPGSNGKITPNAVRDIALRRTDVHYPRPRVLSLTQATECGTVYTADELAALGDAARAHNLHVHMDGARFANAVASLGVSPRALTRDVGVDVLCFGGTKNGMAMGEAIVFFNRDLAADFAYRCKQAGQLASKMRFIAAQWVGLLEDGAWLRHAAHANRCAAQLADRLRAVPGLEFLFPVEANSVFVELPPAWIEPLRARGVRFYTFIGEGGARFMCAWDTDAAAIDHFVNEIRAVADIGNRK